MVNSFIPSNFQRIVCALRAWQSTVCVKAVSGRLLPFEKKKSKKTKQKKSKKPDLFSEAINALRLSNFAFLSQ